MASKRKRSKKKADAPAPAPVAAFDAPPVTDAGDGYIEIELSGEFATNNHGRKNARIPMSERVEISGIFGAESRVTDVSLGGVFIETPTVLEVGDPVQLAFMDGSTKLRVSGRVRWVTPFGGLNDARAGMGIELIGLTDRERARIYELLRGHLSSGQNRAV